MTQSANLTSVTPSFITDASGGVWGLVPTQTQGQQVCFNGAVQSGTSNAVMLLYDNSAVYHSNTGGDWYVWQNNAWALTTDPRIVTPPPAGKESVAGTSVTTAGPAIIDATGESWTLVKSATASLGLQIAVNGKVDSTTNSVTLLYYTNHRVYQENSGGGWWYKTKSSDTWTTSTDPRGTTTTPTITGINLSNATFAGGAATGTVVGSVSVTMSTGTFSGTLALGGSNASSFALAGNNLVTHGTVAAGSYSVSITATQSGTAGPVSHTFALTASGGGSQTLVQVPLGIHLGTWMGDTSAGDPASHFKLVTSSMGRQPTVVAAVGANGAFTGWGAPSQWGGGDSGNSAWGGTIPVATTFPLLTWTFSDGNTDQAFSAYASGQYDSYIQSDLTQWKNKGFKKVYIRPNWEFNNDFQGFGVGSAANIPTWIAAWKHFANVAHAFGAANGMTVKMVWCPTASWGVDLGHTFNQPLVNFFPTPDGSTKYVDVIGPDVYAFSWDASKYPESVSPTTNMQSNIYWYVTSYVQMCQAYGCTFAISELGDLGGAAQNAWQDWIPNHFVPYFNTLKNLNPPVAIEYMALFDVPAGGAYQFTSGNYPNELLGWRKALGLGASGSTPITTLPV